MLVFIEGFEGLIREAAWFGEDRIGIVTNIGVYVFDINDSTAIPKGTLLWMDNFSFKKCSFDEKNNSLFVLSQNGELKGLKIDENFQITTEYIQTIIEEGCDDLGKSYEQY